MTYHEELAARNARIESLADMLRNVAPIQYGALAAWYEQQPGDWEDAAEYEERLRGDLQDIADDILLVLREENA